MITQVLKSDKCTGCTACVNSCTSGALTMVENEEGFEYPICDSEKCNECNLCEKVCPVYELGGSNVSVLNTYAIWSLDNEIRYRSTSGGAFFEIAKEILDNNGLIVGAAYDDHNEVYHCCANDINELKRLMQSKYCQSKKNTIFRIIKKQLVTGRKVLFVGTPCEVAGLKRFLMVEYVNLITCDFICKGNASLKIYRSYLNALEERYRSKICKVWFKEKKYGWNNFSTRIEFASGKMYRKDRYHDLYMRGYVEKNLFLRKCCGDCLFKGNYRFSDITLADFWGAGSIQRKLDVDRGTSLVIINTSVGQQIINEISNDIYMQKVDFDVAIRNNTAYYKSVTHNSLREEFLSKATENNFVQVANEYIKENIFVEIKRNFRNYLHWIVRKFRITVAYLSDR